MSNVGLRGWCCPALRGWHVRSIPITFAGWWSPCSLGYSGREVVGWRWSQARKYARSFWGSLYGRWPTCSRHTPWSSSIPIRTVGWKAHCSGTVLVWSWCCTGMTSKHCSSFWRRFWSCWGDSWCRCPLHYHVWQCCRGSWNSSVVGRSSPFILTGAGCCTFNIMTSVFYWLIFRPTCCAKVLRREVLSCMCWCVCETTARSSAESRSSSVEMRVHLMPRGWSSVVRCITSR